MRPDIRRKLKKKILPAEEAVRRAWAIEGIEKLEKPKITSKKIEWLLKKRFKKIKKKEAEKLKEELERIEELEP